jgi:hypothetical protein
LICNLSDELFTKACTWEIIEGFFVIISDRSFITRDTLSISEFGGTDIIEINENYNNNNKNLFNENLKTYLR